MIKTPPTLPATLIAITLLLSSCTTAERPDDAESARPSIHYLEIVCADVAAQCTALERIHGLTFGPPDADLGQARVAHAPDGTLVGVRASLAESEQPVVRTYLQVENITEAIEEAEAAGGVVAYPPTRQGDTGTWAIYLLGDLQLGLWQR